jgi:cytochrome c553
MKKVLLAFLLLILCSCNLYYILGLKESKNESINEVELFLDNKNYKYDKSVMMNDSLLWMRETSEYIYSERSKIISGLEIRIFDSLGNYYTSFSQCHGDFEEKGYLHDIPILKNTQQDYINQTLSLNKELNLLNLTEFEKKDIKSEVKKYRYTIVVYYVIWANHLSKRVLKDVSEFKKRFPNQVYVLLSNVSTDTGS